MTLVRSLLGLAREEVTGHAELPVGGVHESHLEPPCPCRTSAHISFGIASVGPGADKSREVPRHALPLSG